MANRHLEHTRLGRMRRGSDRVVAGVASGIAHELGVDPIVVRIAFVVLTVASGAGIPIYLLGWWLIPAEDGLAPSRRRFDLDDGDLRQGLALGMVLVGVLLLMRNVGIWFDDRLGWPLTLAGIGVAVPGARPADDGRVRPRQSQLRLAIGGVLVVAGIGV